MRKKISLIILMLATITTACSYADKTAKGNETVAKIEKFKQEKNRLPDALTEVGIEETESSPIHYRKESETKYILWFGKELGESETYDSETKEWR